MVFAGVIGIWGLQAAQASPLARARGEATYRNQPHYFEANRGQSDDQVKFLSRGDGYQLFLTPTELVLHLQEPAPQDLTTKKARRIRSVRDVLKARLETAKAAQTRTSVVRIKAVGANPSPQVVGKEQLPGKVNYFLGNDPTKWQTDVPIFAKVEYRGVYPGIDVVYYGNERKLEYDLVVSPGADPKVIAFEVQGGDKVQIDSRGDLVVQTPGGEVRQHKPFVYQVVKGAKQPIPAWYVMKGERQVGFQVGTYVASLPLIIDPVLNLGPGGNAEGNAIALDSSGNSYVTGWTQTPDLQTLGYPFREVPCGESYGLCAEAFVAKLAPDGLVGWVTYLGGSGSDFGDAIAVDAVGNVYITGSTGGIPIPDTNPQAYASPEFPTTENAFQRTYGGGATDAFVAKLSPTGSLIYSTYFGSSGDDSVGFSGAIAVDAGGNAYVTGAAGPLAFVLQLGQFGTMGYTSYWGPTNSPSANSITVDAAGNVFVAWEQSGSPLDVYVAKLGLDGAVGEPLKIGGDGAEYLPSLATDASGNVYVTGGTDSVNFPLVNPLQNKPGSNDSYLDKNGNMISCSSSYLDELGEEVPYSSLCSSDVFVVKLGPTATVQYSTYLGGSGEDMATNIAVSASGDVYVAGLTSSADFPTVNPLQSTFTGDGQAYVVKLSSTATSNSTPTLLSSSPLPVTDSEGIIGIAVAPDGTVFVGGGVLQVAIKVNPKSINLDEKRTVKVTILSSAAFDPGQVDTSTLTFGRTGTEVGPPVRCHAADKKLMCDFRANDVWFMLGDTLAVLNGLTYSGTSITGTDSIRIVPPKSKHKVMGERKHHHGSRIWKLSTRTRHPRPHFDIRHPNRPDSHQRSH
jgi:hypothetical protein